MSREAAQAGRISKESFLFVAQTRLFSFNSWGCDAVDDGNDASVG